MTPDLYFCVAQQCGCCFVTKAVLLHEYEVGRVHAARLARRPLCVIVMNSPSAVVIAVGHLTGGNTFDIVSQESTTHTSSVNGFCVSWTVGGVQGYIRLSGHYIWIKRLLVAVVCAPLLQFSMFHLPVSGRAGYCVSNSRFNLAEKGYKKGDVTKRLGRLYKCC